MWQTRLLGSAPPLAVPRPGLACSPSSPFVPGVSALSYLLAMKLDIASLASFNISRYSLPRTLVILNILDSCVPARPSALLF